MQVRRVTITSQYLEKQEFLAKDLDGAMAGMKSLCYILTVEDESVYPEMLNKAWNDGYASARTDRDKLTCSVEEIKVW